jgi:RHS repeat-associated protein
VQGLQSASYTYDGDGKLVKAVEDGVTTLYVGSHYQVSGSIITKYYFAGTQRIAMRTNGELNYLLADHLGSTGVVTDAAGTVIAETRYTPYGETRFSTGTSPTDYLYTSQRQEAGLGLYFYTARWYDPALARFTQADTIVPGAGNPQAFDRYAYVLGNPLRYSDPSGHGCYSNGNYIPDPSACDWIRQETTPPPPPTKTSTSTPTRTTTSTPSSTRTRTSTSTTTITPTATQTPTSCSIVFLNCQPTSTLIPSSTPTFSGPNITSPEPVPPSLHIDIQVNWDKVDKIDATIDAVGLTTNVVTIVSLATGAEPVAIGSEIIGDIAEAGGLIKSGYELIRDDPSSMLLQATTSQAERTAVIVFRAERLVPVVGFIGNLVSLAINIKPKIDIYWETP